MSSLREKIEKKKNKYLQAAKNIGKKKDEEDEKGAETPSDEPEEAGAESTVDAAPSTPSRPSKAVASTPASSGTPQTAKEVWKYEGEYNDEGEYHGVGRLYSTTTIEFYEGQWLNGKRHGFGTQLFVTGERYQGAWKGGLMDGMGVISYPTKDSFTGQWELGQRVHGTWNFTNGETNVIFTEKWVNGAPGPFGELTFTPGGKYVGEVNNNVVGKYTIKNYTVFRHGYGEMTYPNKDKYIGGWKKDARKGFGIFVEATGEKFYGEWTRGKRSGYGVQIYTDGTYYEGQHLHDEMKGKGKICLPNGDTIMGEWANNKLANAQFLKGTFDHVPRPMREVFISNVQAIKKTDEKAPFISTEKWQQYVQQLEIDPAAFNFEMVESTLLQIEAEKDSEVKDYAYVIPGNPLAKAMNRFIYLFNWLYTEDATKNNTYALQTAVDDVNSFLAAMSLKITTVLNLDYKANKRLYELLIQTVFHKIYNTLFPLYVEQLRVKDSILAAKLLELKDSTTVTIGVKPKYQFASMIKPTEAPSHVRLVSNGGSVSFGLSPLASPHQPSAPTAPSGVLIADGEDKPPPSSSSSSLSGVRGSARRPTKTLPTPQRRATIDEAGLTPPLSPASTDVVKEKESPENTPEKDLPKESPAISPRDLDPATGQPRPSIRSTKSSRFNPLANNHKRSSSTKGRDKRNRGSMNVGELLANRPLADEDFDELADSIAAEEVAKSARSIPEESDKPAEAEPLASPKIMPALPKPTEERRVRPSVAIDPNDINAQLALEESSRKRPTNTDLAKAEEEFLRKMGPLFKPPGPSLATPTKRERSGSIVRSTSDATETESLSSSDRRVSLPSPVAPSGPVGYVADPNDPRKELPYYAVISAIDRLSYAMSPIDKLECLTAAGQSILKCVDEAMTDKKEQIVMGAEDKFPILIYALIRSNAKNLRAHATFLSDFITEHIGDMDSKYRVSELHDALKYIENLQWSVRDKNGYLVPVKLILSNVAWAAKGLQRIKVTEGMSKSQVIADITVCISQIFRALGDRYASPYEPYEIPSHYLALVRQFKTQFFDGALGKEVGLSLKEKGDGFAIEFELRHPLYVYSQLSQVALAPDSADLS